MILIKHMHVSMQLCNNKDNNVIVMLSLMSCDLNMPVLTSLYEHNINTNLNMFVLNTSL